MTRTQSNAKARIEELENQLRSAGAQIARQSGTMEQAADMLEIMAGTSWMQAPDFETVRFLCHSEAAHLRKMAQPQ